MVKQSAREKSGRFSYEGLDRIMHEKARLSIMTSLLTHPEGLVFNDLKSLCGLTDGNLSRHIQILVENDLVSVWKGFEKNRPKTLCRLTAAGRARFVEYIAELERVVSDAANVAASRTPAGAKSPTPSSRLANA